jgi:biopolymer transport protein ExbD
MTFKTKLEIAKGHLDSAPMVSILFLLLIFLVLSSPLVLQPGLGSVDMPVGPRTTATLQEIVLTVSRDNLIFFRGKQVAIDHLSDELRQASREMKNELRNPEMILKADGQVDYQTLVTITGIALDSGISAVNLATRPPFPVVPAK